MPAQPFTNPKPQSKSLYTRRRGAYTFSTDPLYFSFPIFIVLFTDKHIWTEQYKAQIWYYYVESLSESKFIFSISVRITYCVLIFFSVYFHFFIFLTELMNYTNLCIIVRVESAGIRTEVSKFYSNIADTFLFWNNIFLISCQ